jgi:hypothetical protein
MINKILLIYFFAFITLISFSLIIFGINIINFNFLIIIVSYSLSSIQFTNEIEKKYPIEENRVDTIDNILFPELNHSNIKIRQYYRNKKIYKSYVCLYLIIIFFPLYLIILLFKDSYIGEFLMDFFYDNHLVEKYFKLKKNKVIKTECITENNKEYEVKLFIDGKKEYRYKNKLHRELDHAIFYDDIFSTLKKIENNEFYIYGQKINAFDFHKELNKHKFNNF